MKKPQTLYPLRPSDMGSIGTASSLRHLYRSMTESEWVKLGEDRALQLFHTMSKTVPAYRHFLKKNKVNPTSIKTIADFAQLPELTKKNYISHYSLADRSPNGDPLQHRVIAASSGTTGEPTLWPRGIEQEGEAAAVHELLFRDLYEVDTYPTLAIIGFPMGVYVSGVATTLPSFFTSMAHPNLSILTAGNNKETILATLPKVQKLYKQIILIGHPFFIKDVIESGKRQGINWSKTKVRTFFCSEGFNEEWRHYLGTLIRGSKPERDFFNTYGSSEFLLMGYETPESIAIKSYLESHSVVQEAVLGRGGPINLFQYNPALRYIESNKDGELLFTAASGIPLVRFNLKDSGKVLERKDLLAVADATHKGWRPWRLPYVALYGRNDHTLVFYAANIYPEHIHSALNHTPFLKKITGKFTMEKNYTGTMDQKLIVHIELQEGQKGSVLLQQLIKRRIVETLEELNMEYNFLRNNLDKDLVPKIALHPYRDHRYFKVGLKPRYIA